MSSALAPRVDKLEEKVSEIDKSNAVSREIIDRFEESLNKLFSTLDKLNDTLNTVQVSMTSMQAEIQSSKTDIADIKTKIITLDDKGKFDFLVWLKTVALPVIVSGGLVYLVVKIVESLPK